MLALRGVGKRFPSGTIALADIGADIARGDFLALLGPSGCGKSTLLHLLAGLERPTSGSVDWAEGHEPSAGGIGYVFQDPTLLPWADAAANVHLPLRLKGMSRRHAEPAIAAALARVGLAGFAAARPAELSGGMRMRVSIARALVAAPKLLLMDEPFAALDEFTRHRLQEDMRGLWRETGSTIVFVTHSVYEACFLASRIFIMSPAPGRIAAEITPQMPAAEGTARRTSPAYTALVAQAMAALRAAMPA